MLGRLSACLIQSEPSRPFSGRLAVRKLDVLTKDGYCFMRKFPLLAMACLTAGVLVAGCNVQNLLSQVTPQNVEAAKNLLKDIGVDLKFTGSDGKAKSITAASDIESVKLGDKTLEAGKDYDVKDGKLIFKNLSPEEQKKVNVKIKGGPELKDISIDARKGDQTHVFVPDAEGNYDFAEGETDPEAAFKKFQDLHDKSRVTVDLGLSFKAADVVGVAFKPGVPAPPPGMVGLPAPQRGTLLPEFAFKGLDGGVKFDVQALGPKEHQGDDLKSRLWMVAYTGTGDKPIKVVRFTIKKELARAPGQVDFNNPPPAQTVGSADVEIVGQAEYADKKSAAAGEGVDDPIESVGFPISGGGEEGMIPPSY